MDEAQINPLIWDETDGLKIYGDKTLQTTNNDSSFVGTRRLYNYIDDVVQRQVLKLQEFRVNDSNHRLKARTLCNSFLEPIQADGWIREFVVVCDSSNNSDDVLDRREFIIDIYIKVMPNSQFTLMNLRRVSQSTVITSLLTGVAPT
jgi:phage tail sheath protein FI